jgi:hypothetical protein
LPANSCWREAQEGGTVFTARQVFKRADPALTDLGLEYLAVNRRWLLPPAKRPTAHPLTAAPQGEKKP